MVLFHIVKKERIAIVVFGVCMYVCVCACVRVCVCVCVCVCVRACVCVQQLSMLLLCVTIFFIA